MNVGMVHPGLMQTESQAPDITLQFREREAAAPGVSWGAVFGGAFTAASLSLLLLALGAGFGLSAVSPWSDVGISASSAGRAAIIWLLGTEIIASAMGGYLAGRLRTRWHAIHSDEVHFRDTANGFLSWAVAVIASGVILTGVAASMAGHPRSESSLATDAQAGLSSETYYVSRMFRAEHPIVDIGAARRTEVGQIFAHSLLNAEAPPSDTTYLSQLVAAATGMSPEDAAKRVSDTYTEAWQAEDTARRATARGLVWIFVALLAGAFSASYAATIGGHQRDHVQAI